MKKLFIIIILSFLFLSENIFAQQAPVKNDSSSSRIKKLQLSIQYYPVPLFTHTIKAGAGFKLNNHFRVNLIGAYGKMEVGSFAPFGRSEQDFSDYKNRLKFEIQFPRNIDNHPSLFVAPYLSYYQATVISFHDTGYNYNYKVTESHSKILSPGGIIGVHDEENHFGIELYAGIGCKFQLGENSFSYYDNTRTYQPGIAFRAEASFYFNFYKGRKKKFNLSELLD